MTLKEIYEYIGPLLADESMASQEASLLVHCADGSVEVFKNRDGRNRCIELSSQEQQCGDEKS